MTGNLQATRIGGRMVNVGRMAGDRGEFDFDLHSCGASPRRRHLPHAKPGRGGGGRRADDARSGRR
jgi:hypothetical protein